MTTAVLRPAVWRLVMATALWLCASAAVAAPYAAMVIDARDGDILHARNHDTKLHPASLTKMMTLYVVFDAVERGEIDLDDEVRVSKFAASEPPSKLGLKWGSTIKLRYLIRACAVKSANDAATVLAEAISGSEAAFARRMTLTARALGMTNTTFKNAHGLTEAGHLSTARDMTRLGRHLFYDFPEYYNLFSRRTTNAGIKSVANTNRRLLGNYSGADGIKTGYTRAAGFNLVASAEKGGKRIIATMFGGSSSTARNRRVAELLDMGFDRAPTRVAVRRTIRPDLSKIAGGGAPVVVASTPTGAVGGPAGKVIRRLRAVSSSPRPAARPGLEGGEVFAELRDGIETVVADLAVEDAAASAAAASAVTDASPAARIYAESQPAPRNSPSLVALRAPAEAATGDLPADASPEEEVVVTRVSTSGGRKWGINLGRYGSRYQAQRVLLRTALNELSTLEDALRKVVARDNGFEANFVGLTESTATMACARLAARNVDCTAFGPDAG